MENIITLADKLLSIDIDCADIEILKERARLICRIRFRVRTRPEQKAALYQYLTGDPSIEEMFLDLETKQEWCEYVKINQKHY